MDDLQPGDHVLVRTADGWHVPAEIVTVRRAYGRIIARVRPAPASGVHGDEISVNGDRMIRMPLAARVE